MQSKLVTIVRTRITTTLTLQRRLVCSHTLRACSMSAADLQVTLMTYQIWSYLSKGAFKGYFEQVDLLVVLLAAAIHDIGHPGTNNASRREGWL